MIIATCGCGPWFSSIFEAWAKVKKMAWADEKGKQAMFVNQEQEAPIAESHAKKTFYPPALRIKDPTHMRIVADWWHSERFPGTGATMISSKQ